MVICESVFQARLGPEISQAQLRARLGLGLSLSLGAPAKKEKKRRDRDRVKERDDDARKRKKRKEREGGDEDDSMWVEKPPAEAVKNLSSEHLESPSTDTRTTDDSARSGPPQDTSAPPNRARKRAVDFM